MVLLYLNDNQKEKLTILNNFDESIVNEFCRISIESIHKEITNKTLNTASQKLNIQFRDLKDLIEILTWTLVEFSRLNLNEKEIKESLTLIGIKNELINVIFSCSEANTSAIQGYLDNLKLETLSYRDLEWRIDIKLASRSLRKCIEPEVILKLNLADENNKSKAHLLQTDVTNLVNLTNSLEDALNEIKTNYCRRIFRNIV